MYSNNLPDHNHKPPFWLYDTYKILVNEQLYDIVYIHFIASEYMVTSRNLLAEDMGNKVVKKRLHPKSITKNTYCPCHRCTVVLLCDEIVFILALFIP